MMGYLASATLVASLLGAMPEMPQWESDYGRALEATREAGRPLLIVIDAPNEPKERLEPIRLSENKIAGAEVKLLTPYELCHVDVTTGYGKKVAKVFHVSSYPFVAIIDKLGKSIIFKKAGRMTDSEWRTVLTNHKDGFVPSVHLTGSIDQSYFQSNLDPNYCPSCQNGGW